MLVTETLSQQIAESLMNRIANGALRPGEALVENRLVDEFGTSQSPVREALLMLEHKGFVTRTARRGTCVRRYASTEVTDMYDVRCLLEGYAARKAMQIAPDRLEERMAGAVVAMKTLVEGNSETPVQEYQRLNDQLHGALFEIAGNQTLTESYLRVYEPLTALRQMSLLMGGNLYTSLIEHEDMVEATQRRDVGRLLEVLENHHRRSVESLLNIITS